MEDSAIQIGSEAGEAAPSTELADRLLRRATEPIGVIDVRRPRQQHARTAGWVAQRFALLDHWRTRYAGDADVAAPGASHVLAAPRQPLAAPGQTLSSSIQLAHVARQSVASQPDAGAAASTSPTEQFRVRRRGTPPRTEAPIDARPDSAAPAEGDAATTNSPGSPGAAGSAESVTRSQASSGELRAAEVPSVTRQTAPASSELILPKRLAGSLGTEPEMALDSARSRERSGQRESPSLPAAPAEGIAAAFNRSGGSGNSESRAGSQEKRGERRAAELPSITRRAAPTTAELVLPKRLDGSIEAGSEMAGGLAGSVERSSRREEALPPLEIRAEAPGAAAPVSLNHVEANPSLLSLRLERKVSEAATGLARGRELNAPAGAAAPARMPLAKSSAGQPPSPAGQLRELPSSRESGPEGSLTGGITDSFAERAGSMRTGASPAKVELPAAFPLVQRQPAGVTGAAGAAPGEAVDRRAVATEVRATRAASPEPAMVWRRSAEGAPAGGGLVDGTIGGAGSALPLSLNAPGRGGAQLARQTTTAEPTASTNAESTPPAAAAPLPANENEVDVARLAEQVSRRLARQLAVERERRGGGGWRWKS
jgi:hypothetical protein